VVILSAARSITRGGAATRLDNRRKRVIQAGRAHPGRYSAEYGAQAIGGLLGLYTDGGDGPWVWMCLYLVLGPVMLRRCMLPPYRLIAAVRYLREAEHFFAARARESGTPVDTYRGWGNLMVVHSAVKASIRRRLAEEVDKLATCQLCCLPILYGSALSQPAKVAPCLAVAPHMQRALHRRPSIGELMVRFFHPLVSESTSFVRHDDIRQARRRVGRGLGVEVHSVGDA